jgi:hypothetical protein
MARAGSLAEQLRRLPPAAAVGWFINAWHGIPTLPPPPQPSPIPSLLGQLLVLGRTHPAVCSRQNRLIDPVEVDDGLRCFYVENQGVYRWAYQPGGPDPVVVGQYLDEDGWVAEQQRLSGFLLQVCLFEAVFSARYSASAAWLPLEELAAVLELGRLRSLSTPWRWPEHPTDFHAADAAIAVTSARRGPDGRVGADVMVAAQRLEPLAYLPDRIRRHADRWEHARLGSFIW